MLEKQIIKNKSDKQKLLQIYIPIIQDYYKGINLSYNEIIKHLKNSFNLDVTKEDINLYFEPNLIEQEEDLKLQMINLGIIYE